MAATLESETAPRVSVGRPPAAGTSRRVEVVVWVALCAFGGLLLAGHSMWFDELQAWNIARASHSLGDLWSNLRYEGHPILWYLPLYGLTRFTGDPRAMQVLEWLVLCATYALIVFRAPFPLLARVALAAGYFVTFEYGVISRGYGIGVLLLLVTLDALARSPRRTRVATVALALLAWTSLAGAVLGVAFAATAVWTWRRRAAGPAIVVVVSAAAAAVTCRPPSDFVSFSLGIPSQPMSLGSITPTRIAGAWAGPWRGLVPLPVAGGRWNTNILDPVGSVWVQALFGAALVALVAWLLRQWRFAFRLWLVGVAGFLAFSVLVVLPDRSHYAGEFFLLLVACTWLAYAAGARTPRLDRTLAMLLVVQLVVLLAIAVPKTTQAFAPDEHFATVVRDAGLTDHVVSAQDFDAVAIAAFNDASVFSIARRAPIRFLRNDRVEARGYARMTDASIVCAATEVANGRDQAVALVTDRDLHAPAGWRALAHEQGVWVLEVPPGGTCP